MIMESTQRNAATDIEQAGAIDRVLALGERLLMAVETFAAQLDLPDLGDIELPPVIGTAADQSHLQTVAPLYLASELESAQLLPAVEVLTGLFASGGLQADVGAAAPLLIAFWRGRRERFSATERQAFFTRLFGQSSGPGLAAQDGRNTAFEMLMIDLAETLAKLDANPLLGGIPSDVFQLRTTARQLAANLITRSGGITAFAAHDLLGTIQGGLEILKQETIQQAVGARSVWGAVRNIARRYLREEADVASHVLRGKAGMLVLAWLAESLPQLDSHNGALVPLNHPVRQAAIAWLQASLTLAEQMAGPAGQGS